MKFTLSWLKDHLETDASLDTIVEALTNVGLEVEDVTDPAAVQEAIAAGDAEVDVVGISCITNLAAGISDEKLSHAEVKETAAMVEEAFAGLVLELIGRLAV